MTRPDSDIDWSLATWEGSRKAQLRRWLALTVRERFELLEQMSATADMLAKAREQGRLSEPATQKERTDKP